MNSFYKIFFSPPVFVSNHQTISSTLSLQLRSQPAHTSRTFLLFHVTNAIVLAAFSFLPEFKMIRNKNVSAPPR